MRNSILEAVFFRGGLSWTFLTRPSYEECQRLHGDLGNRHGASKTD
ncbi:hypothetical protein OHT93_13165 [Streptomyces sp. NBC_00191]